MRVLKVTELASVSAGTQSQSAGSSATAGPNGASANCPPGQTPVVTWESGNTQGQVAASGGNRIVNGSASAAGSHGGIKASATCLPSAPPRASMPSHHSSAPRSSGTPRGSSSGGGSSNPGAPDGIHKLVPISSGDDD